jgi:hypothetical protein
MKPPRRRTEPQFRCHPHLQVHLAAYSSFDLEKFVPMQRDVLTFLRMYTTNRIIKHFIQKYKKALKMLKILF